MVSTDAPTAEAVDLDLSEPPVEQWTLVELLRRRARELGERPFLDVEGDVISFAELERRSDRAAAALAGLGVGPGDRVLALATNSVPFVVAMLATHKRRAVFTPINTELKGSFLEHQFHNSDPKVVLVDHELLGAFDLVAPSGGQASHTVLIGTAASAAGGTTLPPALSGTALLTWADLFAAPAGGSDGAGGGDRSDAAAAAVLDPLPSDVCTIMYTSGTTGPAKGVLLPQAHCVLFAKGAAAATGLDHTDRYYVCMPFFHANALLMQVYACLWAGCPATVVKRFSVGSWLDDVIRCGATATNALGVMPEFIFRQPPDPRDRAHRLSRVIAVPIGEDWGAAFEERFGVRLVQGFGMTEVNMVAYSDPADPVIPGCAGRVLEDWFEVVVADPETDEALPAGEVGEILVRPRRPFCFSLGYFKMADKTVESYRNLWFHTGDAGRFDAEGRLYFIDRLKDRIRRRGENISSYEIEQVLNEHPDVVESAAVGVRVEGAGGEEEIKAVLVLRPGAVLEPVALLDYCVPRMPRFAVPRFVEVVDDLDKTASGKVRKQALRDAGVGGSTWDRESVGYRLPR